MMQSQEDKNQIINIAVSEHGSLGLLALGSLGLKIWREKKSEIKKQQLLVAKNKNGKTKK